MKRKILGVTGIRSDYDIMSSVFYAINNNSELDLEIFITGAHLSEMHGYTIEMVRKDGFKIADEVESLLSSDKLSARIKGMTMQMQGLIQTVSRIKPNFLLVLGDREEAMATALVGSYMNIPIAHIAGGDRVVGNVDDQIRHAVTKLAHLHFTTSQENSERILKMGEQPFRVFTTGNPGLDRLVAVEPLSAAEVSKNIGFEISYDEPYIMVIQHVISTEVDFAYSQMITTLEAIKRMGIKTILIYPNSDAGSRQLIQAIHEYEEVKCLFSIHNIPRAEFVNLMRNAKCLVGNSSAGILEAPLLGLPVVNIGNRQKGRLHAENVNFVKHDVEEICAAVHNAVYNEEYRGKVKKCQNPYGDGCASQRIAEILSIIPIDDKLLIKDITY